MQDQINQLNTEIKDLKQKIIDLGMSLTNANAPIELRELMRNEVIDTEEHTTQTSEEFTAVAEGVTYFGARIPDGCLVLKWKNKKYIVPFYETF